MSFSQPLKYFGLNSTPITSLAVVLAQNSSGRACHNKSPYQKSLRLGVSFTIKAELLSRPTQAGKAQEFGYVLFFFGVINNTISHYFAQLNVYFTPINPIHNIHLFSPLPLPLDFAITPCNVKIYTAPSVAIVCRVKIGAV
jgi:hypothetical protein